MKPSILFATLIFLIYSCNNAEQRKTQSTDTLKHSVSSNKLIPDTLAPGKMIQVSSGQTSPYETTKINGCNFDLITKDKDTIYLVTRDENFLTPEGYKIGTKFEKLPKHIRSRLTKEPGWGYYYKLASGWTLGFCEGISCTDKYPKNDSKVKWIFRRS
jgi:hypothetical protein